VKELVNGYLENGKMMNGVRPMQIN